MYRSDHGPERCSRFGPGEEVAARSLVQRPSAHRRFWMIPNRTARFGFLWVSWLMPLFCLWLFRFGGFPEDILRVGCGAMFVVIVVLAVALMLYDGLFVLDPNREILRSGRKDYPFAELAMPRVAQSSMITVSGDVGYNSPMTLEFDTLTVGQLVLFNGYGIPLKRIHKIADLLNAMLAEYHEREEVRAWLKQRGMLDDPEEEVTRVS